MYSTHTHNTHTHTQHTHTHTTHTRATHNTHKHTHTHSHTHNTHNTHTNTHTHSHTHNTHTCAMYGTTIPPMRPNVLLAPSPRALTFVGYTSGVYTKSAWKIPAMRPRHTNIIAVR